jgi:copper chaperone
MSCGGCANSITRAVTSFDLSAKLDIDVITKIVKIESSLPQAHLPAVIEAAGLLSRDKPNHLRAREYTGNLALPLRVVASRAIEHCSARPRAKSLAARDKPSQSGAP